MERLLEAISALVSEVSPEKVDSLANTVASLGGLQEASKLTGWANNPTARSVLDNLVREWNSAGISQKELAGMLRSAAHSFRLAKDDESVQLVWTGPSSGLISTRHTEQALLEVIQSAKKALFIVSFVAFEVPTVMNALNKAVSRGVEVLMLIESSKEHGGNITVDSIASMKNALPGCSVYKWDPRKKQESGGGSVHAKCAVADGRIAFITSANLTSAAMEKNMELGVLVRGNKLPGQLQEHLKALITSKLIV